VTALGLRRLLAGTRLDPYTFRLEEYERPRDVPCLSGAAMLIRRAALAQVGGVAAPWFMYFEDIDICARLGRIGRIRYCPDAVGRHEGAASSPRTDELETWLAVHLEGAINLFLCRHRGHSVAAIHRAVVLLGGAIRIPRSRPRGVALARWALTGSPPIGDPRER
jgi:GT2 family glycosyltransferase